MANLMKRAAEELKKRNAQLSAIRANHKEQEQELVGNVAAVAGAAGAAFVDKKWGDGGEPAKLFDAIPTNAGVGLALASTALLVKKLPMRKALGMVGVGLMCGAAYRYTLDNVDVEPAA